jgi:hypothetical protein
MLFHTTKMNISEIRTCLIQETAMHRYTHKIPQNAMYAKLKPIEGCENVDD